MGNLLFGVGLGLGVLVVVVLAMIGKQEEEARPPIDPSEDVGLGARIMAFLFAAAGAATAVYPMIYGFAHGEIGLWLPRFVGEALEEAGAGAFEIFALLAVGLAITIAWSLLHDARSKQCIQGYYAFGALGFLSGAALLAGTPDAVDALLALLAL